jgi:hypothetical protein
MLFHFNVIPRQLPEIFLKKYTTLVPNILAKHKAKETTTIAVHFNVSAYAPYDVVARFFYSFILFGIFWDEATGVMENILPNIRWNVSCCNIFALALFFLFNFSSTFSFLEFYEVFLMTSRAVCRTRTD